MDGSSDKEEKLLLIREDSAEADVSSATAIVFFSTFIAVLGSFSNGYAGAFTSSAEAGIIQDLGLSLAEYSVFGSISSIGSMIGALFSGKIADIIGRKGTMWMIVFAKKAWLLDLGRFSLGIGIGLQCFAVPVYIGEIAPKRIRGACLFTNELMGAFAMSMMYFIGNLIHWRILAAIGLFFIPESPRWLVSFLPSFSAYVGQENRLESTLQQLRGVDVDISYEANQIRIAVGSTVLVQLGGAYPILSYASSIFEAAGSSAVVGSTALSINQTSAAGMFIGTFLMALAFLLKDFHESKQISAALVLTGMMIYVATFTAGITCSQSIILSEILPANIKALAGSLITVLNWFMSWLTIFTFNFMFQWSQTGTFFIFAAICALTFLFVAKTLPETKGRSLEEIEAMLSN
ncbi:hypothetical protein M9H77_27802 [Catharanthus roseus]|uniref:Uncharacterized protein n=1 Tax=Catharanthus roseus TaxID=4058 RepID=A0ACC0AFP4_CATRO|nr:hypothetical protein M9H77_27802 [Catharanthus roseus]